MELAYSFLYQISVILAQKWHIFKPVSTFPPCLNENLLLLWSHDLISWSSPARVDRLRACALHWYTSNMHVLVTSCTCWRWSADQVMWSQQQQFWFKHGKKLTLVWKCATFGQKSRISATKSYKLGRYRIVEHACMFWLGMLLIFLGDWRLENLTYAVRDAIV